jgi:tetratricopeptide (TPR) repeat protein
MSEQGQPKNEGGEAAAPGLRTRLSSLVRRMLEWTAANQLIILGVMAGVGLSVAIIVGAALIFVPRKPVKPPTLAEALELYDAGDDRSARQMAMQLRAKGRLSAEERGGPAFVLGMVAARACEELLGKSRIRQQLVAARWLDQARDQGFPAGRTPEGLLQLARSLAESGNSHEALSVLHAALEEAPERTAEIQLLLAKLWLSDAQVNRREALEAINEHLAATPADEQAEGLLLKSQILLDLGELEACQTTVQQIPPAARLAGESCLLLGQVAMREAAQMKGESHAEDEASRDAWQAKYREAIDLLRRAQETTRNPVRTVPQATFLVGLCYDGLGDAPAALKQLGRTRERYYEFAEGVAAAFAEADLLLRMGEAPAAVGAYRQAVELVGDPGLFNNPWLTLDAIRRQSDVALAAMAERAQFADAIGLLEALRPIMNNEQVAGMGAETQKKWGESELLRAANASSTADALALGDAGRMHLRLAGFLYYQLAQERIESRSYNETIWNAATCLLEGHDYEHAAALFEEYLRNEVKFQRPQALLGLGKSLLSLGEVKQALAPLEECIEMYPEELATHEVRLLAAKAYQEEEKFAEAEMLLEQNLHSDVLTPLSWERRESLFMLGRHLHNRGKYQEAIAQLSEAVQRYPDRPEALEARYLVADAHNRSAEELLARFSADVDDSTRVSEGRQAAEYLEEALSGYEELQVQLLENAEASQSDPLRRRILRNAIFARAQALTALGRYEEAIDVYTTATNRYKRTPEVLEAYVQMADCYRRLGQRNEARGALEQAKVILRSLENDAQFTEVTNFSREGWAARLDALAQLLNS